MGNSARIVSEEEWNRKLAEADAEVHRLEAYVEQLGANVDSAAAAVVTAEAKLRDAKARVLVGWAKVEQAKLKAAEVLRCRDLAVKYRGR